MPRAYSADIRKRVIVTVGSGASRRAAAEQFEVSASAAVKWLQCWQVSGRTVAKPRGGSTSPLEEHKEWLLDIIGEQNKIGYLSLLKKPSGQGIGLSKKTATVEVRLSNKAPLYCDAVSQEGF